MITKFKKLTSVCLAVIMILSVLTVAPLTADASETDSESISATSGDFEYRVLDDGTAEITSYNGSATELEIPSIVDGYTVTSIGHNAFYDCKSLIRVDLPDEINNIESYAFTFSNLEKISFSDNIVNIGEYAFMGSNIETIILPKSLKTIKLGTFAYCDKLRDIEFPYELEKIYGTNSMSTMYESGAFQDCSSLTEINLPQSLKTIEGGYVFANCSKLKTINIPDSVFDIGYFTFSNCVSLKKIYLPNDILNLSWGVFCGCVNLNEVNIPIYTQEIMNSAFKECKSLNEINITDGATKIGMEAFSDCTSLASITIPKSVTNIGEYAFGYLWDSYTWRYVKKENFTIYGYASTAAETYANENGFTFIALDSQQIGDVNGDGKVSIDDVTDVQKYIANTMNFTEKQMALADVDKNGTVSIDDVTLIQKHLAGMSVIE